MNPYELEEIKKKERVLALKYSLDIVRGRRVLSRNESYLAAVDEIEIFLEASIERVESGETMHSVAIAQAVDILNV